MNNLLTALGLLALGGLIWLLAWMRRHLVVVTVVGTSMEPTFRSGDRLLVRRCGLERVKRTDIVVLEPPADHAPAAGGRARLDNHRWNVKRVAALPGDLVPAEVAAAAGTDLVPPGALVVLGDNTHSVDSRQRGFFTAELLLGVVVRRLS
ncbi:MAG TPA: S26 family signal peptidase [Candidatus Limnocylindrales bacterium]|nr:S26 family signal peptidase [Candidatus Limnocylindrales bacterium]